MCIRALISACAHKYLLIQIIDVTRTIYSCLFSSDEEAAASKRMVFYVFSAQKNIFTTFFIKQTLRYTVFILFYFMLQRCI